MISAMSQVIYFPDRMAATARSKVAAEVRAQMARIDMNQLQLAVAAGISQSTMNRRLKPKAERDSFTVDELERVADVLGVDVSSFFTQVNSDDDPHPDDGGSASAPTRARTWDLRIKWHPIRRQPTEITAHPLRECA